jgi:hypothetical protein
MISAKSDVGASAPERSCVKLLNSCHAAKKYIDNADPPHATRAA